MTVEFNLKKHRKRKSISFNPSHEDIESAMKSFSKKGGTITKLESIPNKHEEAINRYQPGRSVNSYASK